MNHLQGSVYHPATKAEVRALVAHIRANVAHYRAHGPERVQYGPDEGLTQYEGPAAWAEWLELLARASALADRIERVDSPTYAQAVGEAAWMNDTAMSFIPPGR